MGGHVSGHTNVAESRAKPPLSRFFRDKIPLALVVPKKRPPPPWFRRVSVSRLLIIHKII